MPYTKINSVDLNKPYLTTQEAALVLRCCPETLRHRNRKGVGPFPINKDSRPLLYRTESVLGLSERVPIEVAVS